MARARLDCYERLSVLLRGLGSFDDRIRSLRLNISNFSRFPLDAQPIELSATNGVGWAPLGRGLLFISVSRNVRNRGGARRSRE